MKTFIDVYLDSFKLDKPVGSKKYSKKQIKNGSEKKSWKAKEENTKN